jgi:hypothetical protein
MGFLLESLAQGSCFRLAISKCPKFPPNSNNSRTINFKCSLPGNVNYKPALAVVSASNISNEMKKSCDYPLNSGNVSGVPYVNSTVETP